MAKVEHIHSSFFLTLTSKTTSPNFLPSTRHLYLHEMLTQPIIYTAMWHRFTKYQQNIHNKPFGGGYPSIRPILAEKLTSTSRDGPSRLTASITQERNNT
ncbi:hypothetical protein EUGRSUZ_F01565 [Eucalyptus grandis]|uniref:Uncharacterized protein n=2 Tax=Eucalyptus grandis TaxID=71139 RepID=A0ACC3KFL0_EUCGR|nr:hypothetical protein EUGRSUZ_F01565 [Eucalyptus grandis]